MCNRENDPEERNLYRVQYFLDKMFKRKENGIQKERKNMMHNRNIQSKNRNE